MEALEEMAPGPNKDLSHIVKGMRTKRKRPHSPIPFTITTHSPSGDGGRATLHNLSSSPAASSEHPESTTSEDEDTAQCLILLSQGHFPITKNDHYDHNQDIKFNSKRYIEGTTTPNGHVTGKYVYDCKTCGRTFPSFQALGGHRASHKKPKNMSSDLSKALVLYDEDDRVPFAANYRTPSFLSLQVTNSNKISSPSFKVHECSHCGAEFTSGQALGGHMRRHRGGRILANTTLSLSPLSPTSIKNNQGSEESKQPTGNGLSLDLNLPAPEDDHQRLALLAKKPTERTDEEQDKHNETALVLSTLVR